MEERPSYRLELVTLVSCLKKIGWGKTPIMEYMGISNGYYDVLSTDMWPYYWARDISKEKLKSWGFHHRPSTKETKEYLEKNPEAGEFIMSDRKFKEINEYDPSARTIRKGVMMRCHHADEPEAKKAGCLTSVKYFSSGAKIHPIGAAQYFRNHGWVIGAGERADTCPNCKKYFIEQRREKKSFTTAVAPTGQEVKLEAKAAPPTVEVAKNIKAMDRTVKRLIDEKLDAVYVESKGGYIDGWTDDKVAYDVGTSAGNVALVRDEFHGPNTQATDTNKEVEVLKAMAKELLDGQKRVQTSMDHISKLDEELNKALAAFNKSHEEFVKKYTALMNKFQ